VTLCYIALNAAYFHVLRPAQIASSTRVAADAADVVLGTGGAAFMSLVVAVSTFGALNGVILSGPRAYLAMARDRLLVSWAAAIHPRFQTPHRAILLQGLWAVILVSTGTYRALFTRVVYTEWLFFALMAAGTLSSAAARGVSPSVSGLGLSGRPDHLHPFVRLYRRQSDCRRAGAESDRTRLRRRRSSCVLAVRSQISSLPPIATAC
jgi:hypothetical protein